MDHVLFDHARLMRTGLPEAVFCEGKAAEVVRDLLIRFGREALAADPQARPVLFTRLKPEVFAAFEPHVQAGVDYHPLSRTAFAARFPERKPCAATGKSGRVALVSAGTADGFVLWEAARTLEYLGISHTVFEDCGVAGLWRLTERLPDINSHDAVIVVAGLDAALASVLGGLTSKPLFAVPTSVGYGVAGQGRTALSSMLASCAPGVGVMNIDNGYGAACAAARVVNLICA